MNDLETIQRALTQLVNGQRAPADLLGVEPRALNGLYALGVTARDAGRHLMADHIFQRCLQMNPFRSDFWIALAATRQAIGRPEEAGEMYQVAGLLTTDVAPVAYAAACFAQAGQVERARVLVGWVREHCDDEASVAPWLAVVESRGVAGGVS